MSERLRDDPSEWGLTPHEYARREKARLRARAKLRVQAAQKDAAKKRKKKPGPDAFRKPRRVARPLTSAEGVELALCAVDGPRRVCEHRQAAIVISLPFVSFLYERRP